MVGQEVSAEYSRLPDPRMVCMYLLAYIHTKYPPGIIHTYYSHILNRYVIALATMDSV